MTGWPPAAMAVYGKLDHHERSRSELIVLAGIRDDDWVEAIRFLVHGGYAQQSGIKRGTRYTRSVAKRAACSATETHVHIESGVRDEYHDLLEEVLRELDGCEPSRNSASIPLADRTAATVAELPVEEEDTEEVFGVVPLLRARGVRGLIDLRDRGGCLWVVDASGVQPAIEAVSAALRIKFYHKPEGARATGGRAAWWTVAK